MPTKNGIEYDLIRSPYKCMWDGYDFYFSSPRHLAKFKDSLHGRIGWLNDSFSRRFHVDVDARCLAVLQLYMQVETRGFRIYDSVAEEWLTCPENTTLDGLRIRGNG